jgi:hypothetical protein
MNTLLIALLSLWTPAALADPCEDGEAGRLKEDAQRFVEPAVRRAIRTKTAAWFRDRIFIDTEVHLFVRDVAISLEERPYKAGLVRFGERNALPGLEEIADRMHLAPATIRSLVNDSRKAVLSDPNASNMGKASWEVYDAVIEDLTRRIARRLVRDSQEFEQLVMARNAAELYECLMSGMVLGTPTAAQESTRSESFKGDAVPSSGSQVLPARTASQAH